MNDNLDKPEYCVIVSPEIAVFLITGKWKNNKKVNVFIFYLNN